MYCLFIHLPTEGHLSCFHILAIMNIPFLRQCVSHICNVPNLEFTELGAGVSVQMKIPVLTSKASSWDYKGKVLPKQAAWILDVGP